jgi:exodeoxyribonuclease V alpha subunit
MISKQLRSKAREDGAEWYQIFLAEKLTAEAKGEEDLFFFLLKLFRENESGHLRIELDEKGQGLIDAYRTYFTSSQSPFIIEGDDLYLYTRRRKAQEDRFLNSMDRLISRQGAPLIDDLESLMDVMNQEGASTFSPDVRDACLKVNREPFFIITGGPGTGKTTALAGLIHALNKAVKQQGRDPLKIALAAPTGRAAKRMEQSLGAWNINEPARTLHKMLKIRFDTGEPGFNSSNPLPVDLIVVDEASMIDLRMMTLLFDALPPRGHLLLVGDKDQLPSVEAGALFSDFLHDSHEPGHRLSGKILMLKKVYRSNKTIINLASAIIRGEIRETLELLKNSNENSCVHYHSLPERGEDLFQGAVRFYNEAIPRFSGGFREKVADWETRKEEIDRWFTCYNDRIILSPARKGLAGVERLNREMGERLFPQSYHGIPLMMSSNDYDLNLFNGDRGVIFLFAGESHVFFQEEEGYRHIPLTYLEKWEFSWVQTIHKSQGSEFREVMVILPPGAERMLSREILYTALTRAKEGVILYSDFSTVESCLAQGVFRNSRVKEVLLTDPSLV